MPTSAGPRSAGMLSTVPLLVLLLMLTGSTAEALSRAGHVAFFDPARNEILLFGGRDQASRVTNHVFTLNFIGTPAEWRRIVVADPLPPPRESPLAAFIPSRRELLIVGGIAPPAGDSFAVGNAPWKGLTDVWVLRLEPTPRWEEIRPAGDGPSPRSGAAGAYDPVGDRFILQGGRDVQSNELLADVWELRLSPRPVWRKLEFADPAPPINLGHAMIYDHRHAQMLTFGGVTGGYDLWRLPLTDTLAWQSCKLNREAHTVASRIYAGTAFDSLGNGVLVFGGSESRLSAPDLWELQIGVVNETPGDYSPICVAHSPKNPNPSGSEKAPDIDIRPAPAPRVCNSLTGVPRRSMIELGEEQLVAVVIGGRGYSSDISAWSLLGPVFNDVWGFYEIRPAAGGRWLREWRRMAVADDPATVAASATPADRTSAPGSAPVLLPAHQKVVDRWLRTRPGLRLLKMSELQGVDQGTIAMMAPRCGPDYHPCYVRGDFNGDRKEDFAVLLRDGSQPKSPGVIAIFNGPFVSAAMKRPATLLTGFSTWNWGLWCDRSGSKTELFEGNFESDNFTWFVWRTGRYVQQWHESP